ncbi:MAG: outer membrane protein assembly factor BamD [Verrucomicrobiia bacterium]|jgi:outer membrane protein assembly factor BamD
MHRFRIVVLAVMATLLAFPARCPAPIIYRPGEGWETKGSAIAAATPKDQLEQGKEFEKVRNWNDAMASYRMLLKRWPTSIHAGEAQFRVGYCQEQQRDYYRAFLSYQKVAESYQGFDKFDELIQRQYKIGNLFLAGERVKFFFIKTFPSMDRAVEIYEKVIKNAPYSDIAPSAQMAIGYAREKQKKFDEAVAAYQKLIEKYPRSSLAEEAYFNIGLAYYRAATRSEYDQGYANKAVDAFNEYRAKFPGGSKLDIAREHITKVQTDQARGLFEVARFYDKQKELTAALVYYNELIARHPKSSYCEEAKQRVEVLRRLAALKPAPNPEEKK